MHGEFQEPSSKTGCKLPAIIIITFALMFTSVTVLLILLVRNPELTQLIRDLMIITLAIEALVIGLVIILATVQITKFIRLLRDDIKPILDQVNETISTVRSTATMVNDNLTGPIMKIASTLSGTIRFLKIIWPNRN